jgi:ATP phosphoribosyltransferase
MPDTVVAIPKGRSLDPLATFLERAGIDVAELRANDRRLVRNGDGVRYLMLKPDDVPTYVEYGAASLGFVGRDVLLEREYDLYVPLSLPIAKCRLVIAGPSAASLEPPLGRVLRIATKYPNATNRFFAARGLQVDAIFVQGSVELAPVTGLADAIVDLVETGETLRQNGLIELETIAEISTALIVNRVALKLDRDRVRPILEKLSRALDA